MKLQNPVTSDGIRNWQYHAAGDDQLLMLLEGLEYWEEDASEMAALTADRRKTPLPGLQFLLDLLTVILFVLAAGLVLLIICGWVFAAGLSLPDCRRGSRRSEPAERKQGDQPAGRKAA